MKRIKIVVSAVAVMIITLCGIRQSLGTVSTTFPNIDNLEALASSEYEPGNECSGCIMNCAYVCKKFSWGGCVGDPNWHY